MPTNVDEQELKKFAKSADTWWDLGGEFKPLHTINPLRLDFITKSTALANKKVLDVGCGGGILTEAMAKEGATVTGLDAEAKAIAAAEEHLNVSKLPIDYHCERIEHFIRKQPPKFDVITCMEMLEHVPDPKSIIDHCTMLLKPGGSLYISSINRSLKAFLFAIVGAEYVLNLLPKGTHHYDKLIKPAEVIHWARKQSLSPENAAGITYNPITRAYHLTDKTDVNYLLHFKLDAPTTR